MSDVCEEASKVAKVRAEKAEDEVAELATKARQLETELDLTTEKLGIVSLQLEEKEKSLLAAEAEMNALNRRVRVLKKILKRLRRNWLRQIPSLIRLELQLMTLNAQRKSLKTKLRQQMQLMKKYQRNLFNVNKILKRLKKEQMLELEEELRVVANNLKSLEVAEEKANQREKSY